MTSLRKRFNSIIYAIISLFMISSCSQKKTELNNLSVTIEPQKYFLEQLVGDKFKVNCLISAGSNPESFDPTPSQMIALDKSKALFKIGFLGIENTLVDKVKDQSALNIVDCSAGIDIIGGIHHHAHDDEHDHPHGHDGGDPHYWSSLNSAKTILHNMLYAMIELDSANKEFYTSNYNREIAKINDTDSIIKTFLSKSESKAFIIYHPALSYFAKEYNLEQLSIEHEGKNPSPNKLKELIDEGIMRKVKTVFVQQEFDVKNAEVIAKQIGAETHSINLLSYNWHDEMIRIARIIAGENE